jgi:hypothetical protein
MDDWTGPDADGLLSAKGVMQLSFFAHDRLLDVRATFDKPNARWVIAVKEGDRFIAPAHAVTLTKSEILEAEIIGGEQARLLPRTMKDLRDAVVAGHVQLLAGDKAPKILAAR